jgi:hypothetical protein
LRKENKVLFVPIPSWKYWQEMINVADRSQGECRLWTRESDSTLNSGL